MPIFYTDTGSLGQLEVSGSTILSASSGNVLHVKGSGKNIFSVSGSKGSLLEISEIDSTNPEIYVISSASIDIFKILSNKNVSVSGSLTVTGSVLGTSFSGSFVGTFTGTGSFAVSSSNAVSASYALTASYALNAEGGGGLTVQTTTSATYNETATSGNKLVLLNTTSNNITVNLPTAVGNTATIRFKKIGIPNVVTIDANGTETIDGHQTALLLRVYESITIMSDNSNWYIT